MWLAALGVAAPLSFAGWLYLALGRGWFWHTHPPMLRLYRWPRANALLLPLAATVYMAMTVSSAWRHYTDRGSGWKGR